ncbi:rho GTPase-activating protein 27-like, partial [Sinocyclocheilus rhinocerous]|uniref:rho GTPase-activating protein 27-like n=1 Tax=Sinocyclocheilus rhinocerous TaxID=307959 RepID=UPI0007B7E9B3
YAFIGVIFVHQVEDDSALTAVYVNLPRVRRSTPDPSSTIASPLQEFPDAPDTLLLDSAGWEIHTDDQSGQEYYYHPSTGRSTWEYPLSYSMESSVGTEEARSPPSFPQSPISSPLVPSSQRWSSDWEKVLDQNTGRHYFFNPVSGQSSWDPPEDITSPGQFLEDCPWIKSLDDRGRTYYYLRDGSKSQWNLPEYSGSPGQYGVGNGASIEQDTMVSKQNWRHSAGYQEDKSHSSYPQHTPDSDASSSPEMPHNVRLHIKHLCLSKFKFYENAESTVDDTENVCTNASFCSLASRHPSSTSTSEADQKKVRTKLKKFLLKRPTLQSVKDKGYIRENVFGCHLHNLCSQEKTRVPSFVEKCIRTVEKRGLGIDGLYRVSGNLSVIQKLRFKADHEDLDLEEGNWDIHVITGALKLFFRELQEPLFPYNLFNDFINGIKIPDYYNKIAHMRNLVRSLLPPNRETMEALFSHLRKVIQHGDENRMTVQNVAIVFGPTLLKPEVETANIATYMVFQNQIVEFLLNEFQSIFHM